MWAGNRISHCVALTCHIMWLFDAWSCLYEVLSHSVWCIFIHSSENCCSVVPFITIRWPFCLFWFDFKLSAIKILRLVCGFHLFGRLTSVFSLSVCGYPPERCFLETLVFVSSLLSLLHLRSFILRNWALITVVVLLRLLLFLPPARVAGLLHWTWWIPSELCFVVCSSVEVILPYSLDWECFCIFLCV